MSRAASRAVKRLVKMLKDLIAKADKEGFKLAPFIGIACPGVASRATVRSRRAPRTCRATGRAASSTCRQALSQAIPQIGQHDTAIVMHNDGVVQGLSETSLHAGRQALGRIDHRDGARQRALY